MGAAFVRASRGHACQNMRVWPHGSGQCVRPVPTIGYDLTGVVETALNQGALFDVTGVACSASSRYVAAAGTGRPHSSIHRQGCPLQLCLLICCQLRYTSGRVIRTLDEFEPRLTVRCILSCTHHRLHPLICSPLGFDVDWGAEQ